MIQRTSKIALILSLLTLSACASKFYMPANRFLSPESSGRFLHADIKTAGVGVTQVQLADDITSATPDTTPILIKNSSALVGMQMGLVPGLDLYGTVVFGAPVFVGAKYQLMGDPMKEAKSGNFSLSIGGGVPTSAHTMKTESDAVKGESKINFSGYEGMVIVGYRPSDWTLLYTSPFVSKVKTKVSVTRTVSEVSTVTAEPDGEGEMKGATLGLRFGKYFFVSAEVTFTETIWKRTNPTELVTDKFTDSALGLGLGGFW